MIPPRLISRAKPARLLAVGASAALLATLTLSPIPADLAGAQAKLSAKVYGIGNPINPVSGCAPRSTADVGPRSAHVEHRISDKSFDIGDQKTDGLHGVNDRFDESILRVQNGTIILENFVLDGGIDVWATQPVIIRNGLIKFGDTGRNQSNGGIFLREGSNVTIQDVEIRDVSRGGHNQNGINIEHPGVGYTADRVHVSGFLDGMRVGSNTVITRSMVEHVNSLTNSGAAVNHHDAIQAEGGSNIRIECNWLRTIGIDRSNRHDTSYFVAQPGQAILLKTEHRFASKYRINNVTIANNVIAGGSTSLNVTRASNVRVMNNRFEDCVWEFSAEHAYSDPTTRPRMDVSYVQWANNRTVNGLEVPKPGNPHTYSTPNRYGCEGVDRAPSTVWATTTTTTTRPVVTTTTARPATTTTRPIVTTTTARPTTTTTRPVVTTTALVDRWETGECIRGENSCRWSVD